MKKTVTILLAAALLLGLLSGCAAPAAPAPTDAPAPTAAETPAASAPAKTEPPAAGTPAPSAAKPSAEPAAALPDLGAAAAGQAFAVAMTYYNGGFPEGTMPEDPAFLLDATGWYAAWRCRTADCDMIPLSEAEAFQRSIGNQGEFVFYPEYEDYGFAKRMKTADGTVNITFPTHTQRLEELLGVTLETRLEADGGSAVSFTIVRHFTSGETAEKSYRMLFRPSGEELFPYRLTDVVLPTKGARMDPELNFDWDELMAQNSLRFLLTQNRAVCIRNNYFEDMENWLVNLNGELCVMNIQPDYISGQYRGCYFEYEKTPEGKMRARVSGFDESAGSWDRWESCIQDYFASVAVMRYAGTEGDLIHLQATTEYEARQDFDVDKGTLALRREAYYYDPAAQPGSEMTLSFPHKLPDLSFLDGWNRSLRRVHLVWEDYYDGGPHVREETVELPGDWEYIPAEGRYGDYTIYMNRGYTQSYFYPGDNVDYTLYLTTAKG